MTKSESIEFQEIFGASTPRESLNLDVSELVDRQPVPLPMDSELFEYEPAGHAADALVKQAEHADLLEKICGDREDLSRLVTSHTQAPMAKMELNFTKSFAAGFKRSMRVARGDSKRRAALGKIIDKWADRYGFNSNLDALPLLEKLKDSAARFTHEVLVECT